MAALILACGVPLLGSEAAARERRPGQTRMTRAQRRARKKARKKARKLVKGGVVKLREGDYVAALELFSKAFRIYPSPKIQFNIGQTYKELGRYLDAIGAYERFLRDTPKDTAEVLKKLARDNIRELFRKIALLRVQVTVPDAQISVDGQPRGRSPLVKPLRLMPGLHSLVVKKEGFVTAAVDLRLLPGQRVTREVTLQRPRPQVVIWKTIRKPKKGLPVLWTGLALTGAAALVVVITGTLALQQHNLANNEDLPLAKRFAAADLGKRYQLATDGLLIGAGVLAVATLVWYLAYVRPSGGTERVRMAPKTSVIPHVGPGSAGLTLRF